MEQSSELKLSPARLKHFFTHCSLAAARIAKEQKLKKEMADRVKRLRELSLMNASARGKEKSAIMEELARLEKRVGEIIDMQVKEKTSREALVHKLEEKILALQPKHSAKPLRDFERISARLAENVMKLNRIGEAGKKIEKTVEEEKSGLRHIELRLAALENEYKRLTKKKGTRKKELARVKSIIERHKKTIREIKSR